MITYPHRPLSHPGRGGFSHPPGPVQGAGRGGAGIGSLHRRLRACSLGVRAEQFPPGSREYLTLVLFLAARARGQPMEAPGLRR